jgi:hypothetical protein
MNSQNLGPIRKLGNFLPDYDAQSLLFKLQNVPIPSIVNPAKRYGPLIGTPYWETFAQRPEFYSLVNWHRLQEECLRLFNDLEDLCRPHIEELQTQLGIEFRLKLPMMIEITHPPAANHQDTPVRDYTINWYPFENHGHEVYFGEDTVVPDVGDLFLFDVDKFHGTRHPNPGLVTFMSYSLRHR